VGSPGYFGIVATSTAIGAGRENTRAIMDAGVCGAGSAAGTAAAYRGGGKSDWSLPSKDELAALYQQGSVVPGLTADGYWSSSQSPDDARAWVINLSFGQSFPGNKEYFFRLRPIRAF